MAGNGGKSLLGSPTTLEFTEAGLIVTRQIVRHRYGDFLLFDFFENFHRVFLAGNVTDPGSSTVAL